MRVGEANHAAWRRPASRRNAGLYFHADRGTGRPRDDYPKPALGTCARNQRNGFRQAEGNSSTTTSAAGGRSEDASNTSTLLRSQANSDANPCSGVK
jgi:hypothetical protein